MGDRVAVIKQGRLQQVDDPAGPLRPTGQPLRRRVHRLTGDEHDRGRPRPRRRRAWGVAFAGIRLALDDETVSHRGRPSLGSKARQVIVGIRPEDIEDAAIHDDAPADAAC